MVGLELEEELDELEELETGFDDVEEELETGFSAGLEVVDELEDELSAGFEAGSEDVASAEVVSVEAVSSAEDSSTGFETFSEEFSSEEVSSEDVVISSMEEVVSSKESEAEFSSTDVPDELTVSFAVFIEQPVSEKAATTATALKKFFIFITSQTLFAITLYHIFHVL